MISDKIRVYVAVFVKVEVRAIHLDFSIELLSVTTGTSEKNNIYQ